MFFEENKNSNGEQFEKNLSHKWPMPSGLCLSACLSVCLSVCLSITMFVYYKTLYPYYRESRSLRSYLGARDWCRI